MRWLTLFVLGPLSPSPPNDLYGRRISRGREEQLAVLSSCSLVAGPGLKTVRRLNQSPCSLYRKKPSDLASLQLHIPKERAAPRGNANYWMKGGAAEAIKAVGEKGVDSGMMTDKGGVHWLVPRLFGPMRISCNLTADIFHTKSEKTCNLALKLGWRRCVGRQRKNRMRVPGNDGPRGGQLATNGGLGAMLFWFMEVVDTRSTVFERWRFSISWCDGKEGS